MPNITTVLRDEISRIARKEMRKELESIKKSVSRYRSEIAELKRKVKILEQQVKKVGKVTAKSATDEKGDDNQPKFRFSAKGFANNRQRLGLSAPELARMLGVSAITIYNWEAGKSHPRDKQLEAIATLRTMGKREAAARLESLQD